VSSIRLTLLSKPGCHLCDEARVVVASVLQQLGPEASVTLDEVSILDDPKLNERYWDEIPVLLINDVVHNIWRIDPVRLKLALQEVST